MGLGVSNGRGRERANAWHHGMVYSSLHHTVTYVTPPSVLLGWLDRMMRQQKMTGGDTKQCAIIPDCYALRRDTTDYIHVDDGPASHQDLDIVERERERRSLKEREKKKKKRPTLEFLRVCSSRGFSESALKSTPKSTASARIIGRTGRWSVGSIRSVNKFAIPISFLHCRSSL